tara:strand:- start:298 stop:855 length:558 start_codon:yes stop_codon:yes gene_type:complete
MALTYRSVKGSALTISELDGNFEHFTGSHAVDGNLTITGSLTVSGSNTFTNIGPFNQNGTATITGSLIVSGSSNSVFDIDTFDLQITGGLDVSRDVAVRDDLTVYDDTNLRKDVNIGYEGANPGFGYTLAVTQSNNISGSAKFIGGITIESLPTSSNNLVTGSLWISGSGIGSAISSSYLMIFNP